MPLAGNHDHVARVSLRDGGAYRLLTVFDDAA
jgi:hypothetical protein